MKTQYITLDGTTFDRPTLAEAHELREATKLLSGLGYTIRSSNEHDTSLAAAVIRTHAKETEELSAEKQAEIEDLEKQIKDLEKLKP